MRTLRWLWFVWFLIAWSFILTGCLAFVIEHAQDYTKNRDFPETEMDYPGPEDNYLELDPEMNYVLDYMNLKPPEPEESDSIDAEHFNVRATNHRVPDTHSARTKRPSGILGLDNQDFIATAFDTFKNRQRETSSWSSSGSRRVRVRPRPPSTNTSGGRMSTSLSFGDLQRVMNGMKELQAAGKRR